MNVLIRIIVMPALFYKIVRTFPILICVTTVSLVKIVLGVWGFAISSTIL